MADISGSQFDDFRAAIKACVGKWAITNEGGKLAEVTNKRKADDGTVEVELALCAGDVCTQKKFRVLPSLEVSEGWGVGSDGDDTASLMTAQLATKDGSTVVSADAALAGKVVALYFSASWCKKSRQFTPVLKAAYEAANKAGKQFEVVWVSSDNDAASQQAYMEAEHGDWLQLAHHDPLRQALKQKYGAFAGKEQKLWPSVTRTHFPGTPSLVLVGPDGAELVHGGYAAIDEDEAAAIDKWIAAGTYTWPGQRAPAEITATKSAEGSAAASAESSTNATYSSDVATATPGKGEGFTTPANTTATADFSDLAAPAPALERGFFADMLSAMLPTFLTGVTSASASDGIVMFADDSDDTAGKKDCCTPGGG